MSDHGLTPVRPRTTPLEATILDELRELRERVARLEEEKAGLLKLLRDNGVIG